MNGNIVPLFQIGEHCPEYYVHNFKIASFSEKQCLVREFEQHHRHDHYEIIWIQKGKGVHLIDTVAYPYNGSALFLLAPGQIHMLQQTEMADGYMIQFAPTIFGNLHDMESYLAHTCLFDNIQCNPLLKVSTILHQELEILFKKLAMEFAADESDKNEMLSAYLKIILTHISRMKRSQEVESKQQADVQYPFFRDFKLAIEASFRQIHTVQGYADRLNTQARTLNMLSKKYAGKSALELITDRILLEAKRSLHYDLGSVKEIAYKLGFEDPAYFTRVFKKHTGVSPQQYKSEVSPLNGIHRMTA